MSDQPKPATGGDAACSIPPEDQQRNVAPTVQPVGATGEKCPTCGYQLVTLDNDELAKLTEKAAYHELRQQLAAADANAKSWYNDTVRCEEELSELRKQLTAEREKLARRHKLCVDYETKWKAEREKSRILGNMTDGFREQLAAEQKAHEETRKALVMVDDHKGTLLKQLAALKVALKRIYALVTVGHWDIRRLTEIRNLIDAALAI